MLINNPNKVPSKWGIKVLDSISEHLLPYNWRVALLHRQTINVTPDMFPSKPPDRSQLYKSLYPPEEMPWIGGVPLGKIKEELERENFRLIVKQFRHKVETEFYNPPLHLNFAWHKYGGKEAALEAAKQAQSEFTDKHQAWLNQYRVAYDELRDDFYFEVKVHHFFAKASFLCDLVDAPLIFQRDWHIVHNSYQDYFETVKHRYRLLNLTGDIPEITETLKRKVCKHKDNNLLNCRRYNLI